MTTGRGRAARSRGQRPAALSIALLLGLAVAAPAASAARSEIDRKAFRAAYRQVLETYASGDTETAVADLMALEERVEPDPKSMDEILRLKLDVLGELLPGNREVILPIAQLHERAYVAYLADRRLGHAVHSRIMVAQLVEFYADRAQGDAELQSASRIVTSLGARLQENYMDSTAAQLYREALELRPENTAALLGLGEIYERHGQYDQAAEALSRLSGIDPRHEIGHLRLAVCLRRLDRGEEADGVLRAIVASDAASWVLAVAYQELGRSLVEAGRSGEALELLGAAVRRLPDDPTLPVQLAYVADRMGESEPLDLGQALRQRASSDGPDSSRYRYSQMSKAPFEELREELRRDEAEQLPLLAKALDVAGSPALQRVLQRQGGGGR